MASGKRKRLRIGLLVTIAAAAVSLGLEGVGAPAFSQTRTATDEIARRPIPQAGPLAQPRSLDQVGLPAELTRRAIPPDNPQTPEKIALGSPALAGGALPSQSARSRGSRCPAFGRGLPAVACGARPWGSSAPRGSRCRSRVEARPRSPAVHCRRDRGVEVEGREGAIGAPMASAVEVEGVEQMSGAVTDRRALHDALEFARSGDTLIVWKLDRLARSMKQLIETVETLRLRGIGFRSLTEALDTTTAQ